MLAFRQKQRLMKRKNTQLFAIGPDHSDFFCPDGLIDVYRRFSYGTTS